MELLITPPPNFSFYETLHSHGWRQLAPYRWDEEAGTLTWPQRLRNGNIVLLSIREDNGSIDATVTGDANEDEIAAIVRHVLQIDIDLKAFHAFCATRPELAHILTRKQGNMLRGPSLFEDVVKVICTTNTTWLQTKLMTQRIVDAFGAPCPTDPALRAFPTPQEIAAVSQEDFAIQAKLGYRNAAVHGLATDIADGRLNLEAWQSRDIPTEELQKKLLSLKGVGPYAAACLMLYLGRGERVNVDSWARMTVGKELGRPVTDKEVHAFFTPYAPFGGLVYHFYNWRGDGPAY